MSEEKNLANKEFVEAVRADLDALIDTSRDPDAAKWGGKISAYIDLAERLRTELEEARKATKLLHRVYHALHRDGWEPGETLGEVCDAVFHHLCNIGQDPNDYKASK